MVWVYFTCLVINLTNYRTSYSLYLGLILHANEAIMSTSLKLRDAYAFGSTAMLSMNFHYYISVKKSISIVYVINYIYLAIHPSLAVVLYAHHNPAHK